MVTAIFKVKQDRIVAFNIDGHADYAESGSDIVCSAISAISVTIGNGIEEVLNIKPEYAMHDGYLDLSIENNTAEEIEQCQVLMKTMLLSFENLMQSYGDYINVIVEEV